MHYANQEFGKGRNTVQCELPIFAARHKKQKVSIPTQGGNSSIPHSVQLLGFLLHCARLPISLRAVRRNRPQLLQWGGVGSVELLRQDAHPTSHLL